MENYGRRLKRLQSTAKIRVQTVYKRQAKTSLWFHNSLMMSPVGQKHSDQRDGESFQKSCLLSGAWQSHRWAAEVFFIEELWDNAKGSSLSTQRGQHYWMRSLCFAFAQTFESDLEDLKTRGSSKPSGFLIGERKVEGTDRLLSLTLLCF